MVYIVAFIFLLKLTSCDPETPNNTNSTGRIRRQCVPSYTKTIWQGQRLIRQEVIPSREIISYYSATQKLKDQIVVWEYEPQRLYQIQEYDDKQAIWQDTKPMQCLLVGIDQYKTNPLQFCCQDIQLFRHYLDHHFVQYQQPCFMTILLNQQATLSAVQACLEQQASQSSIYSTTIFVFSGHGTLEGLQLYDTDLSVSLLQSYFAQTQSNKVLWIIDACPTKNGLLPTMPVASPGRLVGHVQAFPNPSPYPLAHFMVGRGKAIMFAAKPNEQTSDGVFLHSLTAHLQALENNVTCPQLIQRIRLGIASHNQLSISAEQWQMTPWLQMQGDLQIVVVPWIK